MKRKQLKIKDITQDQNLLTLRTVNPVFVSRYRQAYRHGADMPLITVDTKGVVTSGNHRYQAMRQEFGAEHIINVNVIKFDTERDRLEYFTQENVRHGNPLDGISKKRIALELIKVGASVEEVAALFDVAVKKVEAWGDNCVMVSFGGNKAPEPAPIKRGLELEPGTVISKKEHNEHLSSDRALCPCQLANQLIRWIRNGWIKKTEKNINLLIGLRDMISIWESEEEREAS